MATKYHFNKDTGRTGKCEAKIKCRLGLADSEHFETREEAQAAYESTQESITSFAKNDRKQKNVELKGVEVDLSNVSKKDQLHLQNKWNNRYKLLNDVENGLKKEPEQPSPENLLTESVDVIRARGVFVQSVSELLDNSPSYVYLDGVSDDSDYVVVVSARQGGGNRECYCEDTYIHESGCLALNNEAIQSHPNYVTDYDDDFDSTYNYFVFDNGIKEEQFQEFKRKVAEFRNFKSLKDEIKLVEDKKAPTWFVNDTDAYRKNYSDFEQLDRMYKNTLEDLKNDKEKVDSLKSTVKQVENGNIEELNIDELNNAVDFQSRYSRHDLSNLKESISAKQQAESFRKIYQEAEQLDENSELKNYLLGDRGTGTYNATEKVGRRKVTVRKTYERGSLLGRELKEKERIAEMRNKNVERFLMPLKKQINSYEEKLNKISEIREARDSSRRKVWVAGWIYDSPAPKMSKDFLNNKE